MILLEIPGLREDDNVNGIKMAFDRCWGVVGYRLNWDNGWHT
jgi:hypothetical protein